MILRSSSTPLLGSLLPSASSPANFHFSESPVISHYPSPSFHPVACHLSDSSDRDSLNGGFRRTRSDGNLHSLLGENGDDCNHHTTSVKYCLSKRTSGMLEPIPSFSVNHSADFDEEEEEEYEEETEKGENVSFLGSNFTKQSPLFLARGLGIDRLGSGLLNGDFVGGGGGGAGGRGSCSVVTGGGGERSDIEMHYKKMVEEDPSNALFLRNYAKYLFQVKGNLSMAEEYYSRAILADPNDGEILSEYAEVILALHHDKERASAYFDRAVQASPENSHVLAAHAAFLWEMDDSEESEEQDESRQNAQDYTAGLPVLHGSLTAAAN